MKLKRLLMFIIFVLIFVSCKRENIDLQVVSQIELGAITDAVESRALTTSPLSEGYRFRLYVVKSGETDIANMIATRTYKIVDNVGTSALEAGQKAIKVAQDDYDFYVVGPLMGVDSDGAVVEIASETGVNVHVGNDIISSMTSHTVTAGANVVTPEPLKHLMAKMEVVIERPTTAAYTDLRVDEILLFDQPLTGVFAFGVDGGSIIPAIETHTRKYASPVKESDNRFVATDFIFAHAQKSVKIETTFDAKVVSGGVEQENTYYGQSGSVLSSIEAGKAYEITANPIVPTEILWRLKLVPWHDKKEGNASSDNLELICSFSGLDAPIDINGKKYWKDRSGNDYHGEIVGDIVHNSDKKFYSSTQNNGSYIQLPALGEMKDITVELVMASSYNGLTTPFHAKGQDGTTQANINTPYDDSNLILDWGNDVLSDRVGPFEYIKNDLGVLEGMSTWQYTRKVNISDVTSNIYKNGLLLIGANKRLRPLDFHDVKFLSGGSINSKLYSVRVYRRVLTVPQMVNNANNDKAVYAQVITNDAGKYVQKGLILDLQGSASPSTALVAGRTVWQDQSVHANHAELISKTLPAYDAAKLGYKFDGSGKIMSLLRGLGNLSDCTIELVMTSAISQAWDNLNFVDRVGTNIYTFSSPKFMFNSAFTGVEFKMADYPTYAPNAVHSWSTVRSVSQKSVSLYQNGYEQVVSNASQQKSVSIPNNALSLDACVKAYIGGKVGGNTAFDGYIHAVRVYNRSLSDAERHINYELDRAKYNISVLDKSWIMLVDKTPVVVSIPMAGNTYTVDVGVYDLNRD